MLKPAAGSGGNGVGLVGPRASSRRLDEAFARARTFGDGLVVVQEYLEAAQQGEKRLVWVDGDLAGAYRRMRGPGEFRHNLKQGGVPARTTIDDSDRAIATALLPHLRRNGIRIAGLDVIGTHLIEVNTANPGGLHFASRLGPDGDDPDALARHVVRLLIGAPPTLESHDFHADGQ